ncbi:MAG: hypothetical protein RL204_1247 [Bacteroidota bacterium]|jgi:hypothetical protein
MKSFLSVALLLFAFNAFSQYKGIEIEEVDNGGLVKGRTYRVYITLANDSDQVFMAYGDSLHPMLIQSTKPFVQSLMGGLTSKNISRKLTNEKPEVKFDSYITIGAEDNYNNNTEVLKIGEEFESTGSNLQTKDGAWFCLPGSPLAYAGSDKKVLLMQLTTEGEVEGTFSIMGRTADGKNFLQNNLKFSIPVSKKK